MTPSPLTPSRREGSKQGAELCIHWQRAEQGAPALWKAVPRAMHETRSFDKLLSLSGRSCSSTMAASLQAPPLHEHLLKGEHT